MKGYLTGYLSTEAVLNLWTAGDQLIFSQGSHSKYPSYEIFTLQLITVAKLQLMSSMNCGCGSYNIKTVLKGNSIGKVEVNYKTCGTKIIMDCFKQRFPCSVSSSKQGNVEEHHLTLICCVNIDFPSTFIFHSNYKKVVCN